MINSRSIYKILSVETYPTSALLYYSLNNKAGSLKTIPQAVFPAVVQLDFAIGVHQRKIRRWEEITRISS